MNLASRFPNGALCREMPISRAFLYISLRAPSKGALPSGSPHRTPIERERLHFQSPLLLSLEVPSKGTYLPGPPSGPIWREMPISTALFYTSLRAPEKKESPDKTKSHLFLRVPSKGAPLHVPPTEPLWRDALSPEPVVYLFIHIESPVKEVSHEMGGKHPVTIHRSPHGQKAYIQWGAAWFPKGIVYDTAVTTPVPSSLQHDTFHLGLGRPEPCLPVCVVVTINRFPHHNCYRLSYDPGYGSM